VFHWFVWHFTTGDPIKWLALLCSRVGPAVCLVLLGCDCRSPRFALYRCALLLLCCDWVLLTCDWEALDALYCCWVLLLLCRDWGLLLLNCDWKAPDALYCWAWTAPALLVALGTTWDHYQMTCTLQPWWDVWSWRAVTGKHHICTYGDCSLLGLTLGYDWGDLDLHFRGLHRGLLLLGYSSGDCIAMD
jgi:hypothetical protein